MGVVRVVVPGDLRVNDGGLFAMNGGSQNL